MAISLFSGYTAALDMTQLTKLWKPKASNIVVGRDVAAMTSTGFQSQKSNVVIGDGDHVTVKSNRIFDLAKSATQSGIRAKNFRSITDEELELGNVGGKNTIFENSSRAVTYSDGNINIWKIDEDGKKTLDTTVKANSDMRISWDDNGDPKILTGRNALTNGKLEAKSSGEILIRTSGADVKAGTGSVVFNLSKEKGTFSGGHDVTYLGSYHGASFGESTGKSTFAGYFDSVNISTLDSKGVFSGVFENSTIAAGKGADEFSGYFSKSQIDGGDGENVFSGLFIDQSSVKGGDGKDNFSGRFILSDVDGGAGDDSFGSGARLNNLKILQYADGVKYEGLEADFIHSTVNAGEGDDSFNGVIWGGTLNMGEGNDVAKGVFMQTIVNGDGGGDTLTALYSNNSSFNTGTGNDAVGISTSTATTVNTDEGQNSVTMGNNIAQTGDTKKGKMFSNMRGDDITWQTADEYRVEMRPMEFGEQRGNQVNAEKGDNTILVHDGRGEHAIISADIYEEKKEQKAAPAVVSSLAETGDHTAQAGATAQASVMKELLDESPDSPEESETAKNTAAQQKKRSAIGKYTAIFGDKAVKDGEIATTVTIGDGEEYVFRGIERHSQPENKGDDLGMVRLTHYSDNYGGFTQKRFRKM